MCKLCYDCDQGQETKRVPGILKAEAGQKHNTSNNADWEAELDIKKLNNTKRLR